MAEKIPTFNGCSAGKYCSEQQMTEVGEDKTKIYHRTVTTLTGTGPAYTGSKTETYIVKPNTLTENASWTLAATTTDGGKTQTFTNAAGADLRKSLSPGGNLTKNTQIQTQQTLAKGLGTNASGETGAVLDKINPEQQKKLKIIDPNVASSTEAGTQSADTGEAVTGTKSEFGNFTYPEDLGSTKQDVIKFTMLKYLPSKEIKGGKDGGDNILNLGRDPKAKDRKGIGTVVLPIPAGISDINACNWQGGDLDALKGAVAAAAMSGITQGIGAMAGAIGKGLGDANKDSKTKTIFATAAAAAAAGGDGAALLARTEGIVINPNMELLFNGPTLRPFSFTFKMSARNDKEAKQIIGILNFFKRGMSPIKSQSNLFLKAPNTFRIQYLHRKNGENFDHPYIGRIKECALQSVVVSYAPEGQYATFYDGVMVSYEMQMQFQELEPIFNDDYGKGTGSSGPDKEIGF